MEDETVTFTCEVTKPGGKVVWLRDGQEIVPSKKYETIQDGVTLKLVISDAKRDDQSDYTCRYEEDTTSATLVVEGKP